MIGTCRQLQMLVNIVKIVGPAYRMVESHSEKHIQQASIAKEYVDTEAVNYSFAYGKHLWQYHRSLFLVMWTVFHEVRSSTTVRKENKGNEAAKTAGVTYHVHCIFLSYTHVWDHLFIVTTQFTKTHVRMPLRAWYVFFSSGIASGTLIIVKLQTRPCLFKIITATKISLIP